MLCFIQCTYVLSDSEVNDAFPVDIDETNGNSDSLKRWLIGSISDWICNSCDMALSPTNMPTKKPIVRRVPWWKIDRSSSSSSSSSSGSSWFDSSSSSSSSSSSKISRWWYGK